MNHPSIIANIVGGLGNQMFQYAAARVLSEKLGLPLKVTQDMFEVYRSHYGPELDRVFSISFTVADPLEVKDLLGILRAAPAIRRALASRYLAVLRGDSFIVEPHFHYWQGLQDRARYGGYLQGYWQSERYFLSHAAQIRSAFRFRLDLSDANRSIAHAISQRTSVSVHVRRGDYVNNAKTLAKHGTCSLGYYFSAIETMLQRFPEARFFAFTDDPQWVVSELQSRYPELTLVNHNKGLNSHNDMRLMSLCQHHIIANSSFSWWGAWLNPNPDKTVIAPARWFASIDKWNIDDLIPKQWERM